MAGSPPASGVGNCRPLLPTNKSHVRFEPRSRFLYRVSGYPRWSVRPEVARDSRMVARLTQISDFTARLSTATSSHVSELSAQLVLLRKRFVDARSFLPPYDQRQYEMVPISLDASEAVVDVIYLLVFKANKIVGTSFRETSGEPDFCRCQTKIRV